MQSTLCCQCATNAGCCAEREEGKQRGGPNRLGPTGLLLTCPSSRPGQPIAVHHCLNSLYMPLMGENCTLRGARTDDRCARRPRDLAAPVQCGRATHLLLHELHLRVSSSDHLICFSDTLRRLHSLAASAAPWPSRLLPPQRGDRATAHPLRLHLRTNLSLSSN